MTIKMRYNILYFLYCVAGCCVGGFVAVFLQFKGVSNTLIGVVTGSACVSSIFLTPYLSSLVLKVDKLNVKRITNIVYIAIGLLFCFVVFMPLSSTLVMVLFIVIQALFLSSGPFLQMLASDLMQIGEEVNFGLARGLGSTAWAVSSLVFGFLVEEFSPVILSYGYVFFTVIMLLLLNSMPNGKTVQTQQKKSGSMLTIVNTYKVFFFLLIGFSLFMSAASSLGTYLINIVTSLGGNVSFFGIAVFLMALSEMPVMAMTPTLMKKFKSTELILFAAICYVIRNFLICLAPNIPVLCIGMLFQGFSFGLFTAVITYYVIFNLKPEDQVMGQTMIIVMTSGVGSMLGNLLGGFLQDKFGLGGMYIFVYVLSILGLITILYGWALSKKDKYKNEIIR